MELFREENPLQLEQIETDPEVRRAQEDNLFAVVETVTVIELKEILVRLAMPAGEVEALPSKGVAVAEPEERVSVGRQAVESGLGEGVAAAQAITVETRLTEGELTSELPSWVERVLQIGQEGVWRQAVLDSKPSETVTRLQLAKALALVWLSSEKEVQEAIEKVTLSLFGDTDELPFSPLTKMASGRVLVQDWQRYLDELLGGGATIDVSISSRLLRQIVEARMQALGVVKALPVDLFQRRHFKPDIAPSAILSPALLAQGILGELTERFSQISDQAGIEEAEKLIETLAAVLPALKEGQKTSLLRTIQKQEAEIKSKE